MNEEQLQLCNFCKELDNIDLSTYYYTKEKYRDICNKISNEIWIESYKKIKDFYSRNPDKFMEDYLGIRLNWYQKFLYKNQLTIISKLKKRICNKYISDLFI